MQSKYKLQAQYTPHERSNIMRYIAGIMAFKFAYETLSGGIGLIVTNRFGKGRDATFLAILTSLFNLMQCLFSVAVAQLVKRWPSNILLSSSVVTFGGFALLLILIELCTGGTFTQFGQWSVYWIIPIYMSMGGCLGVVEILRRTIPRDIVGSDEVKLKSMDATVHIFYEVSGTSGAFFSAFLLSNMGGVYSLFVLPVFFTLAGVFWYTIDKNTMTGLIHDAEQDRISSASSISNADTLVSGTNETAETATEAKKPLEPVHVVVLRFFKVYFHSIKMGAMIVLSSRKFVWLLFGYTLPLVLHRFIENVLFPVFAKQILGNGAYSGILLGGSNFGELIGAAMVLLFSAKIITPLPWVRVDALALHVLWILPCGQSILANSSLTPLQFAWCLMPIMVLLSSGWAAGDVSLSAFIQTQLNSLPQAQLKQVASPLGAVMAFLYSLYIIMFTILAPLSGMLFDSFAARNEISRGLFWVVGVAIAIFCGTIIFLSTFIPRGSFALNPTIVDSKEDLSSVDHAVQEAETEIGDEDEIALELVFSG